MSEVRRDGELVARYFYDHSSQRIRKDLFTGGSPTGSTWFVFGHEGLLAEYDTAGALVRKHTWQPDRPWGVDPVCLCALGDDRYYFITDHLFTPQQMLDETFNSVWQAQRLSFGDTLTSLDLVENALGFPGQYFDTESGFYYNWNRIYSKNLGRYTSIDFLRDGSYQYVTNSPIILYDYSGKDPDNLNVSGTLLDFFKSNRRGYYSGDLDHGWYLEAAHPPHADIMTGCPSVSSLYNPAVLKENSCARIARCNNKERAILIWQAAHNPGFQIQRGDLAFLANMCQAHGGVPTVWGVDQNGYGGAIAFGGKQWKPGRLFWCCKCVCCK